MFNSHSGVQDSPDLIPAGTLTKAVLIIKEVKTSKNTGAQFLDIELRCIDGPFEGRKIFDMIMDPFDPNASEGGRKMGLLALTRICETIGIFKPEDEATYQRYSAEGVTIHDMIEDIESQTVAIKTKVEKGQDGHADRARVSEWLTPNPKAGSAQKAFEALLEGHSTMPRGAAPAGSPLAGAKPQTPAVQVRCWHSVSLPGQSVKETQVTQAPAPSHKVPLFSVQAVRAATGGFDGTPAVHTSVVQVVASASTSASSLATAVAPLPSHWFTLQSPAVCIASAVPAATLSTPQVPATQVRVWHSVDAPQSAAVVQVTHAPWPSHLSRPPVPQADSAARAGCEGTPAVQRSSVQSFASTGRSVSSFTTAALPAPSHCVALQSPGVRVPVGVPLATLAVPQS